MSRRRHREGDDGPPAKAKLIEVILSQEEGGTFFNSSDFLRRLSTTIGNKLDANPPEACDFSRSLPYKKSWEPLAYYLRIGEIKEIDPIEAPYIIGNAVYLGMDKFIEAIKLMMNEPTFCSKFGKGLSEAGPVINAELMVALVDNRPLSKNSKLTPIGGVVKAWASTADGATSSLLSHALADIEVMSQSCYLEVKGSDKSGVDGIYEPLCGLKNGRTGWKRTADYKRDTGMTHLNSYLFCPPCIYWDPETSSWCLEWANPSYITSARRTEGYFVREDVKCPSLVTKCWVYKEKENGKETNSGESKPTLSVSMLKDEDKGGCVIS